MRDGVRCTQTAFFDEAADKLRFVSGVRARALENMGIHTVRDLLQTYPRRYLDMTQVSSIASAKIGDTP
ncbi:MAG: hypothetical protein HGA54_04195, partial [Actinobacteria bacterium]|nr:hypothetical protein [Actinomycetota bacterium]